MDNSQQKSGMIFAALAYLCWGFFPIYWKFLKHVPLVEIFCHRVIWAFVFYTLILAWKERKLSLFRPANFNVIRNLTFGSLLLMGNWLVYIYAVNSGQIVESSLGYFINPLVNIVIAVSFLKEKLNRYQTVATFIAAAGVLIISLDQGHIPWIAFFLAITFSLYGLTKKLNPMSALKSNQFESLVVAPLALVVLLLQSHSWVTPDNTALSFSLLIGSGLITGLPLLFFSAAATRIPFYMMGFFQFLSPSLQFLSGVFIFGEPLSALKLQGFSFIWVAGSILLFNTWWSHKSQFKLKLKEPLP